MVTFISQRRWTVDRTWEPYYSETWQTDPFQPSPKRNECSLTTSMLSSSVRSPEFRLVSGSIWTMSRSSSNKTRPGPAYWGYTKVALSPCEASAKGSDAGSDHHLSVHA